MVDLNLPVYPNEDWGDSGLGSLGQSLPVVQIMQPLSQKDETGRNAGRWYHQDTNQYDDILNVVLLYRLPVRTLFGNENSPYCNSAGNVIANPGSRIWDLDRLVLRDGRTLTIPPSAHTNVDKNGDHLCRGCFFAGAKDQNGQWQSGACRAGASFFAIRQDSFGTETPCILRLSWTGAEPLDEWIRKNILSSPNRPLFSCRLGLGTERVQAGNNVTFRTTIASVEPFEYEVAKHYLEIKRAGEQQFIGLLSRSSVPELAAPATDSWAGHDDWGDGVQQEPVQVTQGWVNTPVIVPENNPPRAQAMQAALTKMETDAGMGRPTTPMAPIDQGWEPLIKEAQQLYPQPPKPWQRFDQVEVAAQVDAPGFIAWSDSIFAGWRDGNGGRNFAALKDLVGAPEPCKSKDEFAAQIAAWALAHDWVNPAANKDTLRSMLLDALKRS